MPPKIDRRQYFCALVVAAIYGLKRFTPWQMVKSAYAVLRSFMARYDKESADVAAGRLAHCKNCPIFFAPLQTCGSPIDSTEGWYGCFCYMPVKSQEKGATCWADDNDPELGIGWTTKKSIS